MFATHQPAIASMIRVGTPGWVDRAAAVVMTANMTIKCPTLQVLAGIRDLARDGAHAKRLNFAARRLCYDGIMRGAHTAPLERAWAAMQVGAVDHAQVALAELPGIGLAKSGFVLQMLFGVGGCIDSENEQIYGVKAGTLDKDAKYATRLAKVRVYQALVLKCADGESGRMWDRWCAHVAAESPKSAGHVTAEDISALHPVWVREMLAALWRGAEHAMAAD